jgi:hypothetical protein
MNETSLFAYSLKSNDSSEAEGQIVCVQNIGPGERRKRLTFGVVTLVAGLVIGSLLIAAGANHLWRLILFLPFAGGAIGFFQAREKT